MQSSTKSAAGPQVQDRAAAAAADILEIVTRALTGWLDREPVDFAGARAAIERRLRDEIGGAP
jgi:hypothetical protein